jgi:cytochrome c556
MKMMRILSLMIVGALVAGIAYAQFAKPEEAITYRKSVMNIIVHHFKLMGATVQGKIPFEKENFAANADVVRFMATLPWEAVLTPGSDNGDTTLSPVVFSHQDDFKKIAQSFESDTANLVTVAKTGDLDAVRAGFGAVANNCKACHSAFRKR